MKAVPQRSAGILITMGAMAALLGIITVLVPMGTAVALVMIWGAYALIEGVTMLIAVFRGKSAHGRGLGIMAGIIGVIVGIAALIHPFAGVATFTFLIGIWLLIRGVVDLVAGIKGTAGTTSRVWLIISAVLWIIGGVLFMVNPGVGALTITLWLGILAIAWGVALVVAGFTVRSQRKKMEQANASASRAGV